jgi:hypothetical protein
MVPRDVARRLIMVTARRGKDDDRLLVAPERRPPSAEELERRRRAIEEADSLRNAILARRGGELMPDSAPLIRRERARRSRQI